MQNAEKLKPAISEGLYYGFTGTIFLVFPVIMIESIMEMASNNSRFHIDYSARQDIAILPLFFGLSISGILMNLLFGNSAKTFLLKWVLTVLFSSTMAIVLQKIVLIYYNDQPIDKLFELLESEPERIGLWWAIKLFLILVPFTILFANRRELIGKIKKRRDAIK